MKFKFRNGWIALVIAFVIWAVCAWFDVGEQRQLFFASGNTVLFDFWMPRMCYEQGYAPFELEKNAVLGRVTGQRGIRKIDGKSVVVDSDWYKKNGDREEKFITGTMDKIYPALAILPLAAFPATFAGGWLWTILAAIIYLASCALVLRSRFTFSISIPILITIPLTMPFLFNLERGNPIWISAAAVGVFLAWWDDSTRWKRYVAAACLAIATVMKISPVVLGLLYVVRLVKDTNRQLLVEPLFAAILALILLFVPWFFVPEGLSAFPIMISNAAHHANIGLRVTDFGLVPFWRGLRVILGQSVENPWPGMIAVARLSQLIGLAAILHGAWKRDYFILIVGMLFAAGNMSYYGALYLIPAIILQPFHSINNSQSKNFLSDSYLKLSLAFLFALFMPLQIILFGRSVNVILGNAMAIAICLLRLLWYNTPHEWFEENHVWGEEI